MTKTTQAYRDPDRLAQCLADWRHTARPLPIFGGRYARERVAGENQPRFKKLAASGVIIVAALWIDGERSTFEVEIQGETPIDILSSAKVRS